MSVSALGHKQKFIVARKQLPERLLSAVHRPVGDVSAETLAPSVCFSSLSHDKYGALSQLDSLLSVSLDTSVVNPDIFLACQQFDVLWMYKDCFSP